MFVLTHPTGNTFVRAATEALLAAGLLARFETTIAFVNGRELALLPASVRKELSRRRYDLPRDRVRVHPVRETARLMAARLGLNSVIAHETGWASVDAVYRDLDRRTAQGLRDRRNEHLTGVYGYEDGAAETFSVARELGLRRLYDLPIAYWETSQRLLREEAERLPDWEPTLGATRDSAEKLARKSKELELADVVICPSGFVRDSLPPDARARAVVAAFGTPVVHERRAAEDPTRRLRVLFAGGLSQRKGLADVFAAWHLLRRPDIELVVMGTPIAPLSFYRAQDAPFTYEPPRPHHDVLALMRTCDVLVLPSIVEGRALVQQEAMACGLPLIVTANAGGADLIDEGRTGFLVPIRSPHSIADRIAWFADHRAALAAMRSPTMEKAAALSWANYQSAILRAATAA